MIDSKSLLATTQGHPQYKQSATLRIKAKVDNYSNLKSTLYPVIHSGTAFSRSLPTFNNDGSAEYVWTSVVTGGNSHAIGLHTINATISAIDKSDNQAEQQDVRFNLEVKDTTPPVISHFSVLSGLGLYTPPVNPPVVVPELVGDGLFDQIDDDDSGGGDNNDNTIPLINLGDNDNGRDQTAVFKIDYADNGEINADNVVIDINIGSGLITKTIGGAGQHTITSTGKTVQHTFSFSDLHVEEHLAV